MKNTQREKAAKMLESEILGLGGAANKTRMGPGPVVQANMGAQGAPQTPGIPQQTARPFRKGGQLPRGKMARMSAGGPTMDAGERSGKAEGRGGRPTAADERTENADKYASGGATCMKCGGKAHGGSCKMAKGGHVDEAQDKKLFKRMFKTEESKETKGFAMGGPAKIRRGVALPSGEPNKAKGKQVGNAYSGNKGLI